MEKPISLGGLFTTLKPGTEIELKSTDFVVRNNGPVSAQLHIYSKSRRDLIIKNVETENIQKENSDEIPSRK